MVFGTALLPPGYLGSSNLLSLNFRQEHTVCNLTESVVNDDEPAQQRCQAWWGTKSWFFLLTSCPVLVPKAWHQARGFGLSGFYDHSCMLDYSQLLQHPTLGLTNYELALTIYLWDSQIVLVVKNLPANAGDIRDTGSIPGSGRSPRGGHGNPLQYSCLESPMNRWTWWADVHWVTKSWTWLKRLSMHAHISTSTRIKSCAAAAAGLQHPWKSSEWKWGIRYSVLWEKLAEQAFR